MPHRNWRFKTSKYSVRKKLILANDSLFRQIIRARDKVCQISGRNTNLQVCHYWTRSNMKVRWTEENAVLLNGGIHIFWAHKNPDKFKEWFVKRLGQKKFDELELKARYVAPVKELDLLLINHLLKNKLQKEAL